MDCVLEHTKQAVPAEQNKHYGFGFNANPFLGSRVEGNLDDTSPLDLKPFAGDPL